jgi:hypothetical protein
MTAISSHLIYSERQRSLDESRRVYQITESPRSSIDRFVFLEPEPRQQGEATMHGPALMAGVDLRTVQELGGWKTLTMVQRYAHLAPSHLQAVVERLVSQQESSVELARN